MPLNFLFCVSLCNYVSRYVYTMERIDESFVKELDHVEEEALSYQKKMMARMGGPNEWEHKSTPSLLCRFFMVLWRDRPQSRWEEEDGWGMLP